MPVHSAGMTYIFALQVHSEDLTRQEKVKSALLLCPEVSFELPVNKPEDIVCMLQDVIMSSIQDIRALELRITDIVDDYIQQRYNEDDVLAISHRCGKITVKADAKEKIKIGKTTELYPLKDLVRLSDDGKSEVDNDKISDIANTWMFLD